MLNYVNECDFQFIYKTSNIFFIKNVFVSNMTKKVNLYMRLGYKLQTTKASKYDNFQLERKTLLICNQEGLLMKF